MGALAAACVAVALCDPSPARAAKPGRCTIGAVTALAFGPYDPIDLAPRDSTATVSWDCPGASGSAVRVELSQGQGGDATSRALRWGGELLRYDLYLDAARTRVWGDGLTRGEVGPLAPQNVNGVWVGTVFGRIFPGQDVAAGGPYTDTVQVTFQF